MNPLRTGPWKLTDLKSVKPNGKTVFSCFHCGGGSSMGYKLAGFNVLGGVEIDQEMMNVYKKNHNPQFNYAMGVQKFKTIPDDMLPKELFNLDILDGSPPCSSFSIAGSREKEWGNKKKFREGQASQILDDLFFDFIDIAEKLKPKIVVAENVKGLIQGKAKGYVKQIYQKFNAAGYDTQLFLLNAAFMGVPQRRERTFFIARRRDLELPKLVLKFNEPIITVRQSWHGIETQVRKPLTDNAKGHWVKMKPGQTISEVNNGSGFNNWKLPIDAPAPTIAASGWNMHPLYPTHLSDLEHLRLQTFPDDFNYLDVGARYLCGMSVPPFMMQRVATQIYEQLFSS